MKNKPPKPKTCRACREEFTPQRMGQKECSPRCAIDWVAADNQNKHIRKAKKDRKVAKDNSNSHQLNLTQDSFNKMRRLEELLWFQERGLVPYCISCLNPKGNDVWACGHNKSRGANSFLRFDRDNTFLQCNRRCNSGLAGNIEGAMNTVGYKEGLRHRFGVEEGNRIIEYCDTAPRERQWKNDELKEMRKEFNVEIRRLQGLLDF